MLSAMSRTQTRLPIRRAVDRVRQDSGLGLISAVAMAVFVLLVYVIVVLGGGAIIGRTGSPSVWLSVLATAIVAISFEPVRNWTRKKFAQALHQQRTTPYDVLASFPASVTGSYPAEELPQRMAKVLADGTGAERAEVWLAVHGRLERGASWPPDQREPATAASSGTRAIPPDPAQPLLGPDLEDGTPQIVVDGLRNSVAVCERGELLGALQVTLRENQELAPVEQKLFAGLAAQSGLMLRVAGLRTELEQRLAQLELRAGELRRARRDLVSRQDAERKRLERNIHDGAQQEVLALLVNLRLTQTLMSRKPERAAKLLAEQAAAAHATIDTLTALSSGLYPRLLTESGPVAALRSAVAVGPIPVTLTAIAVPRCAPEVEAAMYFCCLEAVQNAGKHSGASVITIDIRGRPDLGTIEFTVDDNGRGFSVDHSPGNGLANIRDRIESLQGSISISSVTEHRDQELPGPDGAAPKGEQAIAGGRHGTTIRAQIPVSATVFTEAPAGPNTAGDGGGAAPSRVTAGGATATGSSDSGHGPISLNESPRSAGG
jgi:signal transduction histidine kinase